MNADGLRRWVPPRCFARDTQSPTMPGLGCWMWEREDVCPRAMMCRDTPWFDTCQPSHPTTIERIGCMASRLRPWSPALVHLCGIAVAKKQRKNVSARVTAAQGTGDGNGLPMGTCRIRRSSRMLPLRVRSPALRLWSQTQGNHRGAADSHGVAVHGIKSKASDSRAPLGED